MKAIITCKGQIGNTFVPCFVDTHSSGPIQRIFGHFDPICSLGGVYQVGFGSDFDGIDQWISGLDHVGQYEHLGNELCKRYQEKQVQRFLFVNWKGLLIRNLPEG